MTLIVLTSDFLDLEPALFKEKRTTLKREQNAKRSISNLKGVNSMCRNITWLGGNMLLYPPKINKELLENDVRHTFSDISNILKDFKRGFKQLPLQQIGPSQCKSAHISGLVLCPSKYFKGVPRGGKSPPWWSPKRRWRLVLKIIAKVHTAQKYLKKI